jgi:hypothetical protein
MQVSCSCLRFVSPLQAFFCGACVALRCGHPSCTSEAPTSLLCPSCLRRWPAADAGRLCGRCPTCVEGAGEGAAAAAASAPPPLGAAAAATALLAALRASPTLAALCGGGAARPTAAPHAAPREGGGGHSIGGAPAAPGGAPPPAARASGARLLPLLSRRCRACAARGLPGLLVSPAEAPAAPPQPPSVKLYRKHCAASQLLPWLTLLPPGGRDGGGGGGGPPPAEAASEAVGRHAAAALRAAGGAGRAPRLPLLLHAANPFDAPVALVLHFSGPATATGAAAAPAPAPAPAAASLGGCPTPWRRGQLEGAEPAAPALTLLLQGRNEEGEEEEEEEEEGGGAEGGGARLGGAEAEAWASFPWPPGSAPPPWRGGGGGGGGGAKNCAAAPVVLASPGDFSEGVEVAARLSVYLHPAALARWQGVAPLAHATLLPLTALLRVPAVSA